MIRSIFNNALIQFRSTFFEIASIVRLLIGLSQLAHRSKNYHDNVNRFMRNMDLNFMKKRISEITELKLPDLDSDFRKVTGIK